MQPKQDFEVQTGARRRRALGTLFFGVVALVFAAFAAMDLGWVPGAGTIATLGSAADPAFSGGFAIVCAAVAGWNMWASRHTGETATEDVAGFTIVRREGPPTRLDWADIAEVKVDAAGVLMLDAAGATRLAVRGMPGGNALVGCVVKRLWSRLPPPALPATFAPKRRAWMLVAGTMAVVLGFFVWQVWLAWDAVIARHREMPLGAVAGQREAWLVLLGMAIAMSIAVVAWMVLMLRFATIGVTVHPDRIEIRRLFGIQALRFADIDAVEADGISAVLVTGDRCLRLGIAACAWHEEPVALARTLFALGGRMGKGGAKGAAASA